VCLKKERKIQELKKDAKELLTTAGLVRDGDVTAVCAPTVCTNNAKRVRPIREPRRVAASELIAPPRGPRTETGRRERVEPGRVPPS
jgi:hypothetical protein